MCTFLLYCCLNFTHDVQLEVHPWDLLGHTVQVCFIRYKYYCYGTFTFCVEGVTLDVFWDSCADETFGVVALYFGVSDLLCWVDLLPSGGDFSGLVPISLRWGTMYSSLLSRLTYLSLYTCIGERGRGRGKVQCMRGIYSNLIPRLSLITSTYTHTRI